MGQATNNESWRGLTGLWEHQRKALECLEEYLNSDSGKAALIHMPTGTGKSGVIAVLAQCMPKVRHALLLTPWLTLRRQLRDDVDVETSRFWKRVLPNTSVRKKSIVQVWPSSLKPAPRGRLEVYSSEESGTVYTLDQADGTPILLVSTIQALQWLHRQRKERPEYNRLRELMSLVVVDEGHYEPAPDWAQSVRDLGKPTVLFTATPYRNDLKLFDVDENSIYTFTYHRAVAEGYIRRVKFRDASVAAPDAEEFVEKLLKFFHGEFQKKKPHPKSKVIVRCKTEQTVKLIAETLDRHGESVIAVHETFTAKEGREFLKKAVPDPRKTDRVFWVHQFKLMEGLDDSAFSLLAIYEGFSNTRALVQQIGRVVRTQDSRADSVAHVFADARSAERWSNYELFEQTCEDDPNYLKSLRQKPLQKRLLEIQPQIQYLLRDFRPAFNPNAPELEKEFLFALSTNVYELKVKFSEQQLVTALAELYRDEDREVMAQERPDRDVLFWTYLACRNSPVLRNMAFVEGELGYTIYRKIGRLLFYYDTDGGVPDYLLTTASPLAADQLQRLFEERTGNRLFQLSLSNTDMGVHSIRSRTLRSQDLGATAPGISDHAHYLSTAAGYVQDDRGRRSRRYIGFSRGRVSELSLGRCPYDEYIKWLKYLAKEIQNTKTRPLTTFERYAELAQVPEDTEARNILFDLEDVKSRYVKMNVDEQNNRVTLDLDDICLDVKDESFQLLANGTAYTVSIKYDKRTDRYKLSSPTLAEDYLDQDEMKRGLLAYLNISQPFRVVPASIGYIYAHSSWYRPRLPILGTNKTVRLDFLTLFYPVPGLERIESEKGVKGRPAINDRWQDGSLFNLIDQLGAGTVFADFMEGTNILVCDDLDKEIADFIATNTKRDRAVFIHAKAHPVERRRSTSAFSEVCFQAVKNLEFLQPYNQKLPPNFLKWNHRWREGSIAGEVSRIRMPRSSKAAEIWSMISEIIRNPSASREVWLLLAQGFSKGDFEERLKQNKPEPEDVQLMYSIQSTWNAVASIGAQFKIFCSP